MLIRAGGFYANAIGAPGTLKAATAEPINSGLVFMYAAQPTASTKDLVSGVDGTLYGNATVNTATWPASPGGAWTCLETTDQASCLYWPTYSTEFAAFVGTAHTVLWHGVVDALGSVGQYITVPDKYDSWSDPYYRLQHFRFSTTHQYHRFATAGGNASIDAGADTDGGVLGTTVLIGATRNGTTVKFYSAGNQAGSDGSSDVGAYNNLLGTAGPCINHNNQYLASISATSDGIDGRCYWAAIWNRALSLAEYQALYANPLLPFWT